MHPFPYLQFLALIACAASGIFVIRSNPRADINRATAAILGAMALWDFGMIFVQNPAASGLTAQFWYVESICGTTMTMACLPWFFRVCTHRRRSVAQTALSWVLGAAAAVLCVYAWVIHVNNDPWMVRAWYGWAPMLPDTPAAYTRIYLVFFVVCLVVPVVYLVSFIRRTTSRSSRRQGVGMLAMLVVSYLVITAFGVVLPSTGITWIPDISNLVSLIWAVAFPYWAIRHRLTFSPVTATGSIISTMSDGLFITDNECRIVSVNRAAERMAGLGGGELAGRPISDFITGGEQDSVALTGKINPDAVMNYDCRMRGADGGEMQVNVSSSFAKDMAGEVSGMVFIARDISLRIEMEEMLRRQSLELSRSNKELEEFAYVASHDLQEPLRKISAFGERLSSRYAAVLEEQGRDYLQRMQHAAVRMSALIDALLNYSRINTRTQPFEPVNLAKTAVEVLSDLEIRIQSLGARVETGALPAVTADPVQMRQLLQNLIGNGLKYHRPGVAPVVKVGGRITAGEDGRSVVEITVADNGIGIEEQYFERIFGVFQRLHGKSEYEGAGVGLAICRKIVLRHQGSIRVSSIVGEGTTFTVRLPAEHEEDADLDWAERTRTKLEEWKEETRNKK